MARTPTDIATEALGEWGSRPFTPEVAREWSTMTEDESAARAVLDALTTHPDVRERVAAALHAQEWATVDAAECHVCRVRADSVLAALRDEDDASTVERDRVRDADEKLRQIETLAARSAAGSSQKSGEGLLARAILRVVHP